MAIGLRRSLEKSLPRSEGERSLSPAWHRLSWSAPDRATLPRLAPLDPPEAARLRGPDAPAPPTRLDRRRLRPPLDCLELRRRSPARADPLHPPLPAPRSRITSRSRPSSRPAARPTSSCTWPSGPPARTSSASMPGTSKAVAAKGARRQAPGRREGPQEPLEGRRPAAPRPSPSRTASTAARWACRRAGSTGGFALLNGAGTFLTLADKKPEAA